MSVWNSQLETFKYLTDFIVVILPQLDNYGSSSFPVIVKTIIKDPTQPWFHFSVLKSTAKSEE